MTFKIQHDENAIAIVIMDMAGRSSNALNDLFLKDFQTQVLPLLQNPNTKGMIITSAKRDFIVGADLDMLFAANTAERAMAIPNDFKAVLRQLEKWGRPVVAAINGTVLGGGYEVTLGCHWRISLSDSRIKIGLPEATLGLLPGGGATIRLPRMIGIQKALPILLEGKQFSPREALEQGMINDLAENAEELMNKAKQWILANPRVKQPWDQDKFRWPEGDPRSPTIAQMWAIAPSMVNQKTWGNYPNQRDILASVQEGSLVDFDTASRIESRYFAHTTVGKLAKNLITSMWYQMNQIKKGDRRPANIPARSVHKVGILGAGMMGSGIAYVSAMAGMQVVLKDTNLELSEKGKSYSTQLLDKRVKQGRLKEEVRNEILGRIKATDDYADLTGCDLIIEAVFEDRQVKAQVTQASEAVIPENCVFASNTSTLPITGLAGQSKRPEQFIGLHFFSPVDKMQLVEIIMGKQTNAETLAFAFDYVQQIKKVPIVVNDSRGFYTSRVFMTYVLEGLALLKEGQNPRAIESAGLQAGMPVGPLALSDEISLSLMQHILEQNRKDLQAEGKEYLDHPGRDVVLEMVNRFKRIGKKAGVGFYDYPKDGKKSLWNGLAEHFKPAENPLSQQDMQDRLMFVQSVETMRCLQENVLVTVADANIGSILGWGFAPFKGGVLQFINDYGVADFVKRTERLAKQFGPRFAPPKNLKKLAKEGQELR